MVESIILTNEVSSAVLELDMVTTPNYVLGSVDWGQVESTHHKFKYVNQVGVYVTGTSLETRDVVITGWVVADSENQMTDRKKMLNTFVNPQEKLILAYRDYVLGILPNRSVKYSPTVADNNEVICKFQIDAFAPDPLFHRAVENKLEAASTQALFHFPLIINIVDNKFPVVMFGLREPSLIINIFNEGAVSTGMEIVFRAKGTLKNPMLIDIATQQYFKINKIMSTGEEIRIDTNVGQKKIIGHLNGEDYNYFKYRDFGSTWLQLSVGDNLFRYDADENIDGLEVFIYFNDKYLEVQECN